jgi:hypothetical protein
MDVVVELLCRIAVDTNPMNNPMNGLEVAERKDATTSFPRWLIACTSRSMERRKNAKITATHTMDQKKAADGMGRYFNGDTIKVLFDACTKSGQNLCKFSTLIAAKKYAKCFQSRSPNSGQNDPVK